MICEGVAEPWPEAMKMERTPPSTQSGVGGELVNHTHGQSQGGGRAGDAATVGGCARPLLGLVGAGGWGRRWPRGTWGQRISAKCPSQAGSFLGCTGGPPATVGPTPLPSPRPALRLHLGSSQPAGTLTPPSGLSAGVTAQNPPGSPARPCLLPPQHSTLLPPRSFTTAGTSSDLFAAEPCGTQ